MPAKNRSCQSHFGMYSSAMQSMPVVYVPQITRTCQLCNTQSRFTDARQLRYIKPECLTQCLPKICNLPQSLHFSQPTQSITRVIFWKCFCKSCLNSAAFAPFHNRPSSKGIGQVFFSVSLLTCHTAAQWEVGAIGCRAAMACELDNFDSAIKACSITAQIESRYNSPRVRLVHRQHPC